MLYCPQCGEPLIRDGKEYFCPVCGLVNENMDFYWSYSLKNAVLKKRNNNVLQEEIEVIASLMDLPEIVVEEAKRLARDMKGVKKVTPMACALLYVALRRYDYPYTLKDFEDFAPLSLIRKAYRKLGIQVSPPSEEALAVRFANHFGIPPEVVLRILRAINLDNMAPRLKATVAVYAVLRRKRNFMDELSKICKYKPDVIRRCYRKCSKFLKDTKSSFTSRVTRGSSDTSSATLTATSFLRTPKYRGRRRRSRRRSSR